MYRSLQSAVNAPIRPVLARLASTQGKTARVPFKWDDPLDLRSQLKEEEIMVMEQVRSFAQDRLMPGITEAYRNEV